MNYLQFKYEYRAISRILEKHHSVFYKMWEYGIPVLTESVPTAAMVWDSKSYNPLEFRFNPKFWESLDIDSKAFIICHECLHAILLHGERGRTLREAQADKVKINVAMDLAINHMLVNSFDFDRDNVSVAKSGCWVDTVFENMDVPTNLSFEEYYYLLEKNNIDVSMYYCDIESILKSLLGEGKLSINIFDDHEALGDINIKELGMNISKILEDDELESLKNDIKAFDCGRNPNLPFVIPKIQRMYPTNKWEKIVNQWKRIGINPPDDAEIWTKPNRRGDSLPTDIILPTYDFTDD
jgi:predicted metal-dependent peptidase